MNDIASTDLVALQNRLAASERKGRIRSRLSTVALMAALLVVAAPRAVSQGIKPTPTPTLSGLKAELDALRNETVSLRADLAAERKDRSAAVAAEKSERVAMDGKLVAADGKLSANLEDEKSIRAEADFTFSQNLGLYSDKLQGFGLDLKAVQGDVADLKTQMANLANTSDLKTRIEVVEKKTRFMSVQGQETIFSGTNVHIENGTGDTTSTNGFGNLVVGYNESDTGAPRTGSHNVVVGSYNTYTSFGGLVAGYFNRISGGFAVAIGTQNVSSGAGAFTAGWRNQASGAYSSVLGGVTNSATAQSSSVSGGIGIVENRMNSWSAANFSSSN